MCLFYLAIINQSLENKDVFIFENVLNKFVYIVNQTTDPSSVSYF